MADSPSALRSLFLASRPKTWIAGISPVLIGTALSGCPSPPLFFYALLFSLLIQIGTNYSNDYFDFLNGADGADRIGPARAVASGWILPAAMRRASVFAFSAAVLASLPLVSATGTWALGFVASSVAFGILYTGGPKPLGYLGLGELLVLAYFGPIAAIGSYYLQTHTVDAAIIAISFAPGLLSCAILIANNLRDLESDKRVGKKTLAVRFGRSIGAAEYTVCLAAAILLPALFGFYAQLLLGPFCFFLAKQAFDPAQAPGLLPKTALALALFTALFCTECWVR